MSMRGRYIIDRMKRWTLQNLNWSFPVPQFGSLDYWDHHCYIPLTTESDRFEWGEVSYPGLQSYRYKTLLWNYDDDDEYDDDTTTTTTTEGVQTTTLLETMGLEASSPDEVQQETDQDETTQEHEQQQQHIIRDGSILILGCGNSQLGSELIDSGSYTLYQPIVQIDWSSKCIQVMSQLCRSYIEADQMQVIQDNATQLSSISQPNSMACCLDKGLLDGLSCTYEIHNQRRDQINGIFQSVHRVLKPHAYFCVWSLSRPEFFLSALQQQDSIRYTTSESYSSESLSSSSSSDGNRHHGRRRPRATAAALETHMTQNGGIVRFQRSSTSGSGSSNKPFLWNCLDIRQDISNGLYLYRFQKASEQRRIAIKKKMSTTSTMKKKKRKKY